MERTIKYLNSKWYYRFAKIAFVVLFIIIFSRFNYIFINTLGFKSVDGNKTKILCNANSKEFSANDVTGLALSRNDFKNYSFDYKYFLKEISTNI